MPLRLTLAALFAASCASALVPVSGQTTAAAPVATPVAETAASTGPRSPAATVAPLPTDVRQLIVGISGGWSSTRGKLWRYQRDHDGETWTRLTKDQGADILLGRNGLGWGRGALGSPSSLAEQHSAKRERDGRAPAGCFQITRIYGNDDALPSGASFPFRQVTRWDAWPDDPRNPYYNRHLVIDPAIGVPDWFESQRMRVGDPAYRWLIEIRHNADPPVPGAGSAIFFHIRRGPDRLTSGCTTMSEGNLQAIVRWLSIDAKPHYVLLPRPIYRALQPVWKLPQLPG